MNGSNGKHARGAGLLARASLALNVLLVLAIACAGVYKFTDVRYLFGGGVVLL